ncbi:putative quinol monooxygenase [Hymenobacter wooponensis]|uniref:Antibiotic biosynthesis monooxygenase n=1 Tax=Hymenobacter wooponensis TaxID=1525360 RepID=A0A4Z0MDM6_9BACT|nr:antibiotic biosynthesis monooxygenase [Hymenobacter wooponensis]TGD77616.1 antibiotic biosynthesis monooxygenase [Hymenobacter wooponensis]
MEEQKVFYMVKWQIQPGQEEVVRHALTHLVARSRTEPGCLYYQPHASATQPGLVYLYEAYASPAAALAHRETEYFQRLVLGTIVPLLSSREVVEVTPLAEVVNSRF